MAAAGAALIDVGGESTRPGAKPVWEGDETERVLPVIKRLAAAGTAVSIDTRKAAVMAPALAAGAAMVNDVSALTWDPRAAEVVAKAGCPVVLMHHKGDPATMQDDPRYERPVCSKSMTGWRRGSRRRWRPGSRAIGSSSIPASASARPSSTISS